MLRRKIEADLKRWMEQSPGKCLVIRGARQVGKTFSAEHFGQNAFESMISVNFLETPMLKSVFFGNLDVDSLVMNFSLYMPEARFIPGKTLLFLDEIQECPEAVTSLKFWASDQRYRVIASGSMLGIDYKRPSSYPVGSVDYLDMKALDFQEFLWASGVSDEIIAHLRECFESCVPVTQPIHERMRSLMRTYLIIGGMPEVVDTFIRTRSLAEADRRQRTILQDYRYDIAHYAAADMKMKAEMCYFSIPDQLAKANHKFQYSVVEKGANARKYANSIDWLRQADLTVECHNVNNIEYPLAAHEDAGHFRIYPTDIGLLTAMYEYSLKIQLHEDDRPNLLKQAKGGIYEALIAEMLYKNGHSRLFFRKNEQATFEIEFLLETENGIVPVEVKAGNSRSRSLDHLLEHEEIPYGYKLADTNLGRSGKKITLPHYMAMFI